MQHAFVVLFLASAFIGCAFAGNDYLWGEIGPNDYLIAKDTVSHAFFVGIRVTTDYVYKQKDNGNAYTITAIKVTDRKSKNGATAELLSGGPGSKGAKIHFTSERGHNIKDSVEIYGR